MRVVDLAELIRLWGEPPNQPAPTQQNATAVDEAMQQPAQQAQQAILEELRAMRELYLAGLEENRALRKEVRELKEVMLRLPAPQQADIPLEQPARPPEGEKEPSPTDDDPHGFRSLVQALKQGD